MRIVCLLFACVAVALGGSPGYAADLAPQPVYYPPPPPPPLYTWTGFYFGGNGGFGGDQFQYPVTVGSTTGTASLNSSGFFGGGQVGFNWQMAPAWVIGVETDFDGADITGNATASATVGATATAGTKLDWFGTVRGRAGSRNPQRVALRHRRMGLWPHHHVSHRQPDRRGKRRHFARGRTKRLDCRRWAGIRL